MPSDIYWVTIDFTDPSLSNIINSISSKLNYFKGALFTNYLNRDAKIYYLMEDPLITYGLVI